jgi:hypothetical protein
MSILLRSTALPGIPADRVWFHVEVDLARCAPPSRFAAKLQDLNANGVEESIARLICYSGAFYLDAVADVWGQGLSHARIATAWTSLVHWNPQSVQFGGRSRLTFAGGHNAPNPQRHASELLGVGAGLLLARHIYDQPLRSWSSLGAGRLDYEALSFDGSSTFRAEVRGRFDRKGWARARRQVEDKIPTQSPADSFAGILFAPRTSKSPRAPDFLVVDPEIPGPRELDRRMPMRRVLRKYAPYFAWQGLTEFARRLAELADLNESDFEDYLTRGDDQLRRLRHRAFRTSMKIGDIRYFGSAWDGIVWPEHLIGKTADKGTFIDGIAEPILGAFLDGRLHEILELKVEEQIGRDGEYVRVFLDDGRARVWAPTIDQLLEHP